MAHDVLITGGAGFIGSSLALELKLRHPKWQVAACDNLYRRGSELNLPRLKAAGVSFHHADVRQPDDLARLGPFGALVECSAEPSVLGDDDVVVPVNLVGAHHCFAAAARHGAQVLFLSTSRVYPVAAQAALSYTEALTRFELTAKQALPGASAAGIAETFPLDGARTTYGATKLAAELLLQERDLPWVIDRCGVVAGPWQMGKVDQGVFTHWMLSALEGRPLRYLGYGGEGKQVRDLLHVLDLVDLLEEQLQDPAGWAGTTQNVGGGRDVSLSLQETTQLCEQITGRTLELGPPGEDRPGDVRVYLSDCARLHARTAWRPRRGPRQTLQDIHDWVVGHRELVRLALGDPAR